VIKISSILDPVQPTLALDIFDKHKLLQQRVKKHILQTYVSLLPADSIHGMYLIGSTAGYQHTETSDVDVNVIVPKDLMTDAVNLLRHSLNGKLIPGTQHPLNFYLSAAISTDPPDFSDSAFGIYNILDDRWEVPPETSPIRKDPKLELALELKVSELVKNQFLRYISKYEICKKELDNIEELLLAYPEDWTLNYSKKHYSQLLEQVKSDLEFFVKSLDQKRKDTYGVGVGVPRMSQENLNFKVVEHTPFEKLFEELKEKKS